MICISLCCCSAAESCLTLCYPVNCRLPCPSLSPRVCSNSCLWVGDAMQPSHSLSSSSPLAPNLSLHQGLFQWVSSLHQVAKYWSFSFRISPSNEYSRLISFRIEWFDLLAVQGTLKSLLQHHSSKASILRHSAFSMVRLSHSYMTYWKNHSFDYVRLCRQSDVSAL